MPPYQLPKTQYQGIVRTALQYIPHSALRGRPPTSQDSSENKMADEIEKSPSPEANFDEPDDEERSDEDQEDYRPMPKNRGRGGFRNRGRGGPHDFGPPRGPPPGHGPPRFRGRGYGPRGPPGYRGPPPPHFGPPRGPRFGPRGPPPGFDPNWGPGPMGPPGMHPHHMMGPPPGMPPPHMMGGPGPGGPMGMGGPPNSPYGPGGPMNHQMNQNNSENSGNMNGNGGIPGLDLSGEVWVETKTGEGKSYFYNARTRETTWTRPDGPNTKIITQEQVEAAAQAAGVNPNGAGGNQSGPQQDEGSNGHVPSNQQQGGGPMPNTMQPPPGMMQGPPPGMPPFGGPPPHFGGGGGSGGPPPFGMPPPGFPGYSGYGGMPPGPGPWGMPPGQGQGPGLNVGPVIQQPSTISAPPVAAGSAPPQVDDSQIDPDIVARGNEWTEHKAPDGRAYFYNAKAGESVWEKPAALRDLETARLAAAQGISTVTLTGQSAASSGDGSEGEPEHLSIEKVTNGELKPMPEKEEKMEVEDEESRRKREEEEEKARELQRAQDKSRPVSSTPVPGTPWCVVWTGDGRVFFYNPSSRTSVWERPEDLIGRTDVDKMVAASPDSSGVPVTLPVLAAVNSNSSSSLNSVKKKRADSSSEDEEPSPKKTKKDDIKDEVKEIKIDKKQIDIGKEAAIEAEVRAARERAIVPLDIRIKSFRDMLAEKDVSAFSTWEKELHKIVFDPRYLLLTSKERKQVFEKYVKERAEEERREKRNKMRERKDDFRRLMEEAALHGKSSFSDFAQKHGKDDRFKNVEKMRERESLFNEYILEVRKREKEEKVIRREQVRKDFVAMLHEQTDIDRHSRWGDVKKKLDSDPRYKAVDSSTAREDWFREHIKIIKEERKKEKEKERERKDKDRRENKDKEREKEKEKREEKKEEKKEETATAAAGTEDNEESEEGKSNSADEREKEQKDKEKQARVEVSLREREKEVQRTLATHLRDRDKEREQHKHDEAVQHLNALLADLVRNAELAWREVRKQLRKDHRWELAESLDREEKEKLFNHHIEQLTKKKKEKFRELLDENGVVTLTSSWRDIKKMIKDDPRYSKFSSSERKCEREFKEYIKDKLVAAKADFRELLQETKLINHKTLKMVQDNEQQIHDIEEILKKDRRYLVLDYMPEDRTKLLVTYLEDLDKRGPPPPPTASEPSRRPTK